MYILKGRKTDVKNVPGWVDGWHVKGVLGITYSGAIAERSRVCECSRFHGRGPEFESRRG